MPNAIATTAPTESEPPAAPPEMQVRANRNRNIICIFRRGPRLVYFLGIDGPQLSVCQMEHDKFEREFYHIPTKKVAGVELEYSALDFAMAYMRDAEARKMVPIAPSALRVLTAIIRGGQPAAEGGDGPSQPLSPELEKIMATAKDEGFRKPEGPVAKVHKFLDGKFDQIKKGTVSRKELIEALVAKGIAEGTAVTQAGVWARNNGIGFARPTVAAEKKAKAKGKAKGKGGGSGKPSAK